MATRAPKTKVIDRILNNPVYLPESGMRMKLAKVLERMSGSDLAALDTIIAMKMCRAEETSEAVRKMLAPKMVEIMYRHPTSPSWLTIYARSRSEAETTANSLKNAGLYAEVI